MAAAVDLLILGGGIQGLALLREFAPDYSVLLLDGDPALSESLHFHGYFSSGWNAADPHAAEVYCRAADHWRQLLAGCGLESRQTRFHAALPPEMVAALDPNWRRAAIEAEETDFPAPFVLDGLPRHRCYRFDGDLVFDGAAAWDCLRRPFAARMAGGRVRQLERRGRRIERVVASVGGETWELRPQWVLSACGAGNAGVLAQLGLSARTVRDAQLVRPMHMLLCRGSGIPPVSGFLLDLVVLYHPLPGGEGLWILTLNPAEPGFTAGPIDMSRPPAVEPELVRGTLARLAAVLPDFPRLAAESRWSLYVGAKTDAPGPLAEPLLQLGYPRPYHWDDFGLANFVAVWPNHWCLSTAAAAEVAQRVRGRVVPRHRQPSLVVPELAAPGNRWQRSDLHWRDWSAFAAEMEFQI